MVYSALIQRYLRIHVFTHLRTASAEVRRTKAASHNSPLMLASVFGKAPTKWIMSILLMTIGLSSPAQTSQQWPPQLDSLTGIIPRLQGEALVHAAVEANVWQSAHDLLSGSPATRNRVAAGTLKVVGAVYDLKTGKVEWLGEHPQQQELLRNRSR